MDQSYEQGKTDSRRRRSCWPICDTGDASLPIKDVEIKPVCPRHAPVTSCLCASVFSPPTGPGQFVAGSAGAICALLYFLCKHQKTHEFCQGRILPEACSQIVCGTICIPPEPCCQYFELFDMIKFVSIPANRISRCAKGGYPDQYSGTS